MTNFISFSVFGTEKKYLHGAIQNAEIAKAMYPHWQAVFYIDQMFSDSYVNQLEGYGAKVVLKDLSESPNGFFWRFEATGLEDAETVIFRDVDSRLTKREASAVDEWLSSKLDLHAMRDHPFHCSWILAGMWGVRGELMRKIHKDLPVSFPSNPKWGFDQRWLADRVYAPYREKIFVHDSFYRREESFLFPDRRLEGEYVGEVIDEYGSHSEKLRDIASRAEYSSFFASKLVIRDWLRTRMEQRLPR